VACATTGVVAPCSPSVVFHFVAEGRAFVRQADTGTMELQAGELAGHALIHPLDNADRRSN
jgi:hypothetical protein